MKILIMLFVCSTLFSCRIAYIRSVPPPKVRKIIIIPLPINYPPHPKPLKPKPEKKMADKRKKRPERPVINRPKRPDTKASRNWRKTRTVYTR